MLSGGSRLSGGIVEVILLHDLTIYQVPGIILADGVVP